MIRGYLRKVPGLPISEQAKIHAGHGVTTTYHDEELDHAIKAIRPDQPAIGVAGSLRVLGDNRDAIDEAVRRVHGRGGHVVELISGKRTDRDGVELMAAAIREFANERRKGLDGKLGAKARWGTPKRMPEKQARQIWENTALTTVQAIQKMDGWTVGTAYRLLDKRGAPAGRR